MFKWIGKRLAVIGNQYFTNHEEYIHNYLSCFCNYFLIDFVSEVFIINVTVKKILLSEIFKEICYNVESLKKLFFRSQVIYNLTIKKDI